MDPPDGRDQSLISQQEFIARLIAMLDACGIPYMLCGSVATSFHGEPRATNDIDIVIECDRDQLQIVLQRLHDADCYVSDDAALEAIERSDPVTMSPGMPDAPYIKPDRPSPEQIAAWNRMTFEQKLELADRLRTTALQVREAFVRSQQPNLSDDQIRECMREYLLHGAA